MLVVVTFDGPLRKSPAAVAFTFTLYVQLATFALIDTFVTEILIAPATAVISATVAVSVLPPGQVVRLLGLSSMTRPEGRESTQPIPVFNVKAGLLMVKVSVDTWPTSTCSGQNDFDKVWNELYFASTTPGVPATNVKVGESKEVAAE